MALIFFLLLSFGAAALGGLVTYPAIPTWYAHLAKPSWTPPNYVFGPAWTFLYITMAFSAWLVYRRRRTVSVRIPLASYFMQLTFNAAWSVFFFGMKRPDLAFVDIVMLILSLALTIKRFLPISRLAGLMLIPYALWISYAAALNAAIWQMN